MKMLFIKQDATKRFKYKFSQETLKKLRRVKLDYLKLFKYTMIISGSSLLIFLIQRQIPYFNHYNIYCIDTEHNKKLMNSLLPIDYKTTPYLPSCLLQMVYNELKSKPEIKFKREYVKAHDGGIFSFDWVVNDMNKDINSDTTNESNQFNLPSTIDESDDNPNKIKFNTNSHNSPDKLLVILHGLTGGSESTYIREIIEEFKQDSSFKIVAVNYRGISESPLLAPFIYHAGYTEDLHTAMKHLKNNYPSMRCYAIGTSMGANIFTKFLGTNHDFDDYIKGFISVSNPFNCVEVEKKNRGGVLDMFIIRRQVRYVEKHKEMLKQKIGIFFY
jgi:predicted alpha/beta-fold hydrolase